jgi:hypothetical protein
MGCVKLSGWRGETLRPSCRKLRGWEEWLVRTMQYLVVPFSVVSGSGTLTFPALEWRLPPVGSRWLHGLPDLAVELLPFDELVVLVSCPFVA